jgi:hypothetical protein
MNRLLGMGLLLLLPLRMSAAVDGGNLSSTVDQSGAICISGNQSKSYIDVTGSYLSRFSTKELVSSLRDRNFGKETWVSGLGLKGFKLEEEVLPVRTRDVFARMLALKLGSSAFEEVPHSEDANAREELIQELLMEARSRQYARDK